MVPLHVFTGELGGILFLWVFIELLNNSDRSLLRAKAVAFWAIVSELVSWVAVAAYYLTHYQQAVKGVIKESNWPWAHGVILETKEHIFMFIPLLAIAGFFAILQLQKANDDSLRKALKWVSIVIFLMAFLMAGMGFIVSMAARLKVGGGV
jgi:hypothetical protein